MKYIVKICTCSFLLLVSIGSSASEIFSPEREFILPNTAKQGVSFSSFGGSATDSLGTPSHVDRVPTVARQYETIRPLAFRTNLLLNLAGGPNLGVEVPVLCNFSVAGDFAYAHTRINNRFALQTIQYTVEGRYWFSRYSRLLTGWNIGVYGTYCSRFDVQWNSGLQGDGFWSAGLSGGYSVPLSESFSMDFSVMGGYLYSPEIRYYNRPVDGHLLWRETRYNVSRLALTQVRINLVWLLRIDKKVTR